MVMNDTGHFRAGEPLSSEQACIAYLFQKRWPWGFRCSFCGAVQEHIAPAYTVVCRICRKQTSITAQTVMHGSKKNLVSWMRVAWQFCFFEHGLSARKLQQMMELSCYHTAWKWLQKIRLAAAVAETAPCGSEVLITLGTMPSAASPASAGTKIILALEVQNEDAAHGRIRLAVLDSLVPAEIETCINRMVDRGATLLVSNSLQLCITQLPKGYRVKQPGPERQQQSGPVFEGIEQWLSTVYRGTIDCRYLQSYLDEFVFRYNTASWVDRLAVLDHLLTGLVRPVKKAVRQESLQRRGGGYA